MALPRKLKNLNLFLDGTSYIGVVQAFTPPKLTRKTESYRGGGMDGAVQIDMGLDDGALDLEWTIGGQARQIMQQYGITTASGVLLRFSCALQRDDSGEVDAVDIVLRGRHKEFDRGEFKPGDDSSTKIKTVCTYYKETVNGVTDLEIDLLNMIEIVGGVDRLAEQRRALGI